MGVAATFDEPLYLGTAGLSSDIPGTYDVALNGHGYMINTIFEFGRRDSFRHVSIAAQRSATDISNQPGESSINPQGLWRSEANDWSMGSGQLFADRHNSLPNRYHHGQGVDVFTQKGFASLLPDTSQLSADSDPTAQIMVVGKWVIKLNSTGVGWSTGGTSFTPISGITGTPVSMCTDGNTVYVACGTGGVYSFDAGTWTSTHFVNVSSNNVYFVAFCANVLLVANANSLYQVSGAITTWPTALITQASPSWLWSCATAGSGWIYIGGYSGGTASTATFSAVYKTQMASDGTALTAPTVATPLPPGEAVYSLFAFVNYILMGTDLGVRFCQTLGVISPSGQDTGLLKIGPVVPNLQEQTTLPVRCFTANQRFAYFGWSNYSDSPVNATSTCTGLGWLDISTFTGEQTPAYTSHMMVPGAGEITSLDWFNGYPIFTVAGKGVYSYKSGGGGMYAYYTQLVTSGNIQSGYIGFRIPDQKIALAYSVDVQPPSPSTYVPLDIGDNQAVVGASITQDDINTYSLGVLKTDPTLGTAAIPKLFSIPQVTGELFETTLTLHAVPTTGVGVFQYKYSLPVRRATLQAYPAITAGKQIIAALTFAGEVDCKGGIRRTMDVYSELAFLEGLRFTQQPFIYQEGSSSWTVVIDSVDMVWYQPSQLATGGFEGVCMVTMKTATSGLLL